MRSREESSGRGGIKELLKEGTAGSITLEASLIFPWIVLITFILLFFCLFISQGVWLYYSSSIAAERAAFNWSNAEKVVRTGAYANGQYDGLYWRLTDDSLVQGLFGLSHESSGAQVDLQPNMQAGKGYSATAKLTRAGYELSSSQLGLSGELSYRNIGVMRKVKVTLMGGWLPLPLAWFRGNSPAAAQASALIVEPAEFIRTFDLARYYAAKMQTAPEGKRVYQEKAATVIRKRSINP